MAPQVTLMAMDWFMGKLAVVTGGGSGMGRELARQLAARGCSVAACDWNADAVAGTAAMARAAAAAEAAAIILDQVQSGAWRILIGQDAKSIDAAVRAKPEAAYDYTELFSTLASDHVGDTLASDHVGDESDERSR